MRIYFVFFLIILVDMSVIPANAKISFITSRKIDCGSFSAKSYTVQYDTDLEIISKQQKIIVFQKSKSKTVIIDLDQHYSSNTRLNGLKVLDDEAYDWFCLKAGTGRRYLWIGFYCGNEGSKSCRYNSERGELYSDMGRNMHLDRLTEIQVAALYKRLRIPSALPDGGIISPAHDILF